MKWWWGHRRLGPFGFSWALGNFPHPTWNSWWELESMGAKIGIGDGSSDDIVAVEISVPTLIVRQINRLAGYK
jgi:hypothetical protein